MESHSPIVLPKDKSKAEFIPNILGQEDWFVSNIIFCGQTQSGKTYLLNYLLRHYFCHLVDVDKIILFSPTARMDDTYRGFFLQQANKLEKKKRLHIYDDIDMKLLEEIVEKNK